MPYRKRIIQTLPAALLVLAIGCGNDNSVPVNTADPGAKSAQAGDGLPQNIIDAVNEAKPGGTIVSATTEREDGQIVYEVKVDADGQLWEVEVSTQGKVLEVELDDDEDGEADDDGEDADGTADDADGETNAG